MKNFVGILILLIFCTSPGAARKKGAFRAFELGEYQKAAEMFRQLARSEKNKYAKGEYSFYMGECYRLINMPQKAMPAYQKAVRNKYEIREAELYLAQMLLKAGKPDLAQETFESYLEKKPTDVRAINGLASCKMVIEDVAKTRYKVEKERKLNSKFSDYSPCFYGEDNSVVYLSTMRPDEKKKRTKKSKVTGQPYSRIFSTKLDAKGNWEKPKPLITEVDSVFDEGACTVASDGKVMYYTRCRYSNTQPIGADIMMRKRTGGKWGEPERLALGADSIVFGHPAISPDGNTLYFVSNMPGGVGGKDIWKVEKTGSKWSLPVNLGDQINTIGEEDFPYVREDGTLYICSDAQVGYGGLDIYRVNASNPERIVLENMGKPINSNADDFGITFNTKQERGFFTTSRESFKGVDKIYSFELPELAFYLTGTVYDEKSNSPIEESYIRVVGSDGTNEKISVPKDGEFKVKLAANEDFVILVSAPNYFNQKNTITTKSVDENTNFSMDFLMLPSDKSIILSELTFEDGQSVLSSNAMIALERVITILKDNPSVKIEVNAFSDDTGDEAFNMQLSQQRATSIVEHLKKRGVFEERLVLNSFGNKQPFTVNEVIAKQYKFMKIGNVLTNDFIVKLSPDNQKIARQLNRRVEFKILNQ